jgi:tungstate transport system substrate-binding protein
MANFFLIAGPPEDPAKARGAASAADALRRIAESRSPYASRGDDSGTHQRERALLRSAGLDPAGGWPGFVSTGSGMGQTLRVAGERRAYALSDAATFLAFRERVGLVELSKREPALRNVYSVLVFRPAGRALAEFLLSPEAAREIAAFGRDRFGEALFAALRLSAEPDPS